MDSIEFFNATELTKNLTLNATPSYREIDLKAQSTPSPA